MAHSLTGAAIDSSVCIKWFCLEEETEKALSLRESHIKGTKILVVPALSLYEIANAVITLAFAFNITVYDAVFLAVAKELSFECITADEKLYQKTKTLGYVKRLKDTSF